MEPAAWILSAGQVRWDSAAQDALAIGLATGMVAGAIPGWIGVIAARRTGSSHLGIALLIPFLVIGIASAIIGVVLLSSDTAWRVGLGLLGGGGGAVFDSPLLMWTIAKASRKRQKQMPPK